MCALGRVLTVNQSSSTALVGFKLHTYNSCFSIWFKNHLWLPSTSNFEKVIVKANDDDDGFSFDTSFDLSLKLLSGNEFLLKRLLSAFDTRCVGRTS